MGDRSGLFFFFQAEDGIRDSSVTGVQTCALPILATTFAMDLQFSDSIFIMGSNMAECHPVAFRWVIKAKTRPNNPCTVIHADPRFTRTSAMADIYAPVRAGSDIVFLGALIKSVLDKHADMLGRLKGPDRGTGSDLERF